jgi:hypothetical protein
MISKKKKKKSVKMARKKGGKRLPKKNKSIKIGV